MLLTDKNGSQIYLIFILVSGAKDKKFYTSIREHPFFTGLDFENLQRHAPAALDTFVKDGDVPDPIWSKCTDLKSWCGERRILGKLFLHVFLNSQISKLRKTSHPLSIRKMFQFEFY